MSEMVQINPLQSMSYDIDSVKVKKEGYVNCTFKSNNTLNNEMMDINTLHTIPTDGNQQDIEVSFVRSAFYRTNNKPLD